MNNDDIPIGYVNGDFEDRQTTALHVAVKSHDLPMVELLVENGFDVDALDYDKRTPLAYLYDRKSDSRCLKILKILLTRTADHQSRLPIMPILCILRYGCKEAVDLILQRTDNDLEVRDNVLNSAVHYLALNRVADAIEALRDRQFNVNVRNQSGCTPLKLAAEAHLPHAVKFLLEKGADVDVVNDVGCSPLLSLIRHSKYKDRLEGARKCVELLLEYGFDAFHVKYFDEVSRIHDELTEYKEENARMVLTLVEPILAHLAIVKARGIKIDELCFFGIQLQRSWIDYFSMCERQVERMKMTTVFGSVTLLKFLTESDRKRSGYARNEELVSEMWKVIENFEANSPYVGLIRKRLMRAIRLAELREKAVYAARYAVARLVRTKSNAHYFPAEYIVDYLSDRDMKNLHLAFSK